MSFCPENAGNWSPSPQNESQFYPRSVQSCFPLLQGPSCKKSPSALFRSNWVTIPDRIEKNKRETALDRFYKTATHSEAREPISNIFWAKGHANILKGTFSTESNCIRIGLSAIRCMYKGVTAS